MIIENFNLVIDTWIETIKRYNFKQLCAQPNQNYWSLGQVCVHLINDTNWFITQIEICLLNDDNAGKNMSSFAQLIFANNSFPDKKLTNPANADMPLPTSKEALINSFIQLKINMNDAVKLVIERSSEGKTQHPGLGYFNANEWLQFAEMHLRHHLKQKKIIEEWLQKIN